MLEHESGVPDFYDCNATIGRAANPVLDSWLDRDALLAELAHFGIGAALISHVYAQELDYREGNDLALAAASDTPRLQPIGTVFPTYASGRGGPCVDELDDLLAHGCPAIRMHPNPTHHIMDDGVYPRQFPFVSDVVGPLCERLERRRVPLLVELAQVSWPEVYEICRTFPRLPLVLLNVSYTHKRSLFAGFDRHENLYSDTGTYHAYRGLEEVCTLFGATRMLFGTRLPTYNALAAVALIQHAAVSAAERCLIAGENLRRLLSQREESLR